MHTASTSVTGRAFLPVHRRFCSPNMPHWILKSGAPLIITPSDPTFSIGLINEDFNNVLALANNVDPAQDVITVTIPIVPAGGGYVLEFVNPENIDEVFVASAVFSIAPAA
ncbi:hypothetical protein DFH07DRAFT_949334 [Mycena maculata]|uniref:Uncharacterized protein n=1 Tax=Mycena maculata TaxID=230809 RepID=A0AAD7KBZ4_9AGAR|nr:hypothetical protein DFH07DRAFT_949334 [Mycena maculata]